VCPVASFYAPRLPNATKELRVMYFPTASAAKLKDPHELTLHIGFNHPFTNARAVTIPFTRKDDRWEAVVPISEFAAMYVLFFVKDDKTGELDDNAGNLWDVVFCDAEGNKDANGIQAQAQGFTGASWSASLRRRKDYDRALSIISAGMAQTPRLGWWWM